MRGFTIAFIPLFVAATSFAQVQATLKNGDYGGGAAIPPTSGIVNSASGVTFVSTEGGGRSNALVNWELPASDRVAFRTGGTVSFCFLASRSTFVGGEIVGENYGFGAFRNGQGSFSAVATRVLNGEGAADDQVSFAFNTWHNGQWHPHGPTAPVDLDRVHRVGFAWVATPTRFEIWINGTLAADENGATLPWGGTFGTGSATNVGLGDNHERGFDGFNSAAGVTFSDIRISTGHQATADTAGGCLSMAISGPPGGLTGQAMTFEAQAGGCNAAANGWNWSATNNGAIRGGSTRTASITWSAAGSAIVSVSNSGCPGLSASHNVSITGAPAAVSVTSFPSVLVQEPGSGGASSTFSVTNDGDTATSLSLSQQGNFFTVAPMTFALGPRATQLVTITGTPQPANAHRGSVSLAGAGVPTGTSVPIVLLSVAAPTSSPKVTGSANRVDVTADPGTSPSGSVSFRNDGAGTMTGVLASTVPWLIPQGGLVTIPAGSSSILTFSVDRSRRPDSESPLGSVSGDLQLVFRTAASGKGVSNNGGATNVSVATVSVVDTAKPGVTTGGIPPLLPGEVALFVPGVGHVTGSVGVFLSDLSLVNTASFSAITDARLFYTPLGGAAQAQILTLASLASAQPFALADVVKTVFNNDSQIGSLQIRTKDISKLSVAANVFNVSNPAGTYGTALPVFRSDRAVAPGGKLYLTGLRRDASSHTNLYLQETAGLGVTINTEFISASGSVVGTRSDTLAPWVLIQLGRIVPDGAVAAVLTNAPSSPGRFLAYATPVDAASGDTWAVGDWRLQGGFSGGEQVLIPIAGALHGANSTYFRTDIAVMNTGSAATSPTLRYYNRSGPTIDKVVTLAPLESLILNDVVTTFFGVAGDSAGYLTVTPPAGGILAVTSRTYTTVINDVATFGTGVPTRSLSASLRPGDVRQFGGVDDASLQSISAARPATFRTNFALVETSGDTAAIRVTIRFLTVSGKVSATVVASRDFGVGPRQFQLFGNVTREVLGAARELYGDLRNLQIEFAHIGGNGTVEVFLAAVDNGTGDTILRVD